MLKVPIRNKSHLILEKLNERYHFLSDFNLSEMFFKNTQCNETSACSLILVILFLL